MYAWADQPTTGNYTPYLLYTSHPLGGTVYISRSAVGQYTVEWAGVDPAITNGGGAQVTAYGTNNAQCKVYDFRDSRVQVQCFAPNGTPVDAYFMVLFHS